MDGEWDIPRLTKDAYDLKGKTVGTVAAGRIGCHVIKRLKVGLDPNRGYHSLAAAASALGPFLHAVGGETLLTAPEPLPLAQLLPSY